MRIKLTGFTPQYDILVHNKRYGKVGASVFGGIERLSHKFGYCIASKEYLSKLLDVTEPTIRKYVGRLKKDGYIEDLDEGILNRPHRLRPTGKLNLEIKLGPSVDGGEIAEDDPELFEEESEQVENSLPPSDNGRKQFTTGSKQFTTSLEEGSKPLTPIKESLKKDLKEDSYFNRFETWKEAVLKPDSSMDFYNEHIEPIQIIGFELPEIPENIPEEFTPPTEILKIACLPGDSYLLHSRIFSLMGYKRSLQVYLKMDMPFQIELTEIYEK